MRIMEFWWSYNLRWILGAMAKPKKPERRTGSLTVMGGASVPSNFTDILEKSPKFGLEPCVPPHELAALNRRIAERAPEEDRERCLLEGMDCLAKNVKRMGPRGVCCGPKDRDPRMPGSCHDSFVWRHSALRRHLTCGLLNDEEFLLGILKSRFRCLQSYRTLHYSPRKAATIVATCVALHNLCLQAGDPLPDDPEDDDTSCTSDAATRQVQPPQAPSPPLAQVVPPPRALLESAKQARSAIINMFRLTRNLYIAYLQSVRRRMRRQMRRRQT
ncbi:hypothetical protein HPB49_010655 [Dermacentor silvarum]|uniref:Uncharacterized protein n=1 Tax=Dermacentor silvarum TaxID=543639 RepID=A0ACB8D4L5_DERSI|nr:hypothetical protein HPB49_010655 [Dermacentor silvarum]